MELEIEALVRFAKFSNSTDPVGFLENILFTSKMDEVIAGGNIIETSEGGRTVKFSFSPFSGYTAVQLLIGAIRNLEREITTGKPPAKVHQADFSCIEL